MQITLKPIKSDYDALVCALTLAITAPDEERSQKCVEYAEMFASGLTADEVERAKAEADAQAEEAEKYF